MKGTDEAKQECNEAHKLQAIHHVIQGLNGI
jgi:hypothetical protein